ncbi:DUF4334 domain-containing protein [uncultured Rhodospira sp.]|uniref:DUF4334 domain-containing protein n=1 Tax=uncultured Rhodospira sp. TaxID=1936189 RepID=UPI002610C2C3|nr:DUF4334 domain-containing protein [uncultured Rhodospira sp.]
MAADDTSAGIDAATRLRTLLDGTTAEEAMALFDALPAVAPEEMTGGWRGLGLATGHRLDGVLERCGWHGKRFDGPDEVHPLVFETPCGSLVHINPALLPMGLVLRFASLLKRPAVAAVLRRAGPVLGTRRPAARLRLMVFRGVPSAAMIYDRQPIVDVFRKIDDTTVLGVMDMREDRAPFFFVLRRIDP